MIRVIVKKEVEESWISDKHTEVFKHKDIRYYLYILYYKIKGYEVGVLEDDAI